MKRDSSNRHTGISQLTRAANQSCLLPGRPMGRQRGPMGRADGPTESAPGARREFRSLTLGGATLCITALLNNQDVWIVLISTARLKDCPWLEILHLGVFNLRPHSCNGSTEFGLTGAPRGEREASSSSPHIPNKSFAFY